MTGTGTSIPGGNSPPAEADPDAFVFFNGIDAETGQYAIRPQKVEAFARLARAHPLLAPMQNLRGQSGMRTFGLPPGVSHDKLDEAGWGIVCHEGSRDDVKAALAPLIDRRRTAAGPLFKALDYKTGEQARDWYRRHNLRPGSLDPEIIPYYLLIAGPPDEIPFEFQYLLGVDYAVGRLSFPTASDYARYAQSVVAYETAGRIRTARQIAYWGTRHPGDGATRLSAAHLIGPLAQGDPAATGQGRRPLHARFDFRHRLMLAGEATREALLATLCDANPPALLFTASHGMQLAAGHARQRAVQGALLCQDWPGFGTIRPDHYLCAGDVPDTADLQGLIAFFFACFAAGTPTTDQFVIDPAQLGTALPPLAPAPFVAALPQRLLSHPGGGALAVVAHVDRAWGFSIQAPGMSGSQIQPFRNMLGFIMAGERVGHALKDQFGGQFAALSAQLLHMLAPGAAPADDRELVTYWLERTDAQNYVLLGDPAVRVRIDKLN